VAKAEILAGVCGFRTTVRAWPADDGQIALQIESECAAVCKLAAELTRVDPYREFSWRGEGPLTARLASRYLTHPACPVPSGIIKAVEVAAGLALPADAMIKVSRSDD